MEKHSVPLAFTVITFFYVAIVHTGAIDNNTTVTTSPTQVSNNSSITISPADDKYVFVSIVANWTEAAVTSTNGSTNCLNCTGEEKKEGEEIGFEDTAPPLWCPESYVQLRHDLRWYHSCRPRSCANVSVDYALQVPNANYIGRIDETTQTTQLCVVFSQRFRNCPRRVTDVIRHSDNGTVTVLLDDIALDIPLGDYFLQGNRVMICTTNDSFASDTIDLPRWCMPYRVTNVHLEFIRQNESDWLAVKGHELHHVIPFGFYETNTTDRIEWERQITRINNTFNNSNSLKMEPDINVCFPETIDVTECLFQLNSVGSELLPNMSLITRDKVEELFPLGHYLLSTDREVIHACLQLHDGQLSQATSFAKGTLALLSCIFCLITLLAHTFYPAINYHQRALLCLTAAMSVMYMSMAVKFLSDDSYGNSSAANLVAFSVQYTSALSSFFWLNVLAFDLWFIFSRLGGTLATKTSSASKRRFLIQCCYASGAPVTLCVLVLGIGESNQAQHNIGIQLNLHTASWFHDEKSIFVFFYLPIVTILITNIFFFVLTIVNLRRASQGTRRLENKTHHLLLRVFAKLFVVMGLCWFVEVISWLTYHSTDRKVWHVLDSVNLLQGVWIFLIYACKRSTLAAFLRKLGCERSAAWWDSRDSSGTARSRSLKAKYSNSNGEESTQISKECASTRT